MSLPRPSFSFWIPSVHDGTKLECRLYIPGGLQDKPTPATRIRGAIVAHPYAPLGGCYNDPVVNFIGRELYEEGFVVGTFNFRYVGAGRSGGRTSWTAKPELADYVSFYGFMLQYLRELLPRGHQSETEAQRPDIQLVLGGYSYGSLIASHVPTVDIGRAAGKIAASTREPPHEEGGEISTTTPCDSICVSYLLVSPLLPPVSSFLTVFSTLAIDLGGRSAQARPARPAEQLSAHRTLALFGDGDAFTSVRKLQRWSAEMGRIPQSRFQGCEIKGAGHFWREDGVETEARRVLREWLRGI
ncbi:hypothetical protein N7470_010368 [Penicillium chermesinum]|nr:hypothetical protein N7470_010368 [Penicillium chermesinum]